MVLGKSSDDDNIPSSFKQFDGLYVTDKESEASHICTSSAANLVYPPFVSLPGSPMSNLYGTPESYTEDPVCNNGTDFMTLGTLQSSKSLRGGSRNQGIYDTGFPNPQVNFNCFPSESNSAGGDEMNPMEGAMWHDRNWLHMAASSGASISSSTVGIFPSNDIKVDAFHPYNNDGSFLTLGLGGDADWRPKARLNSRGTPATVSPLISSSYVQQTATNLSNMIQNSTGGFWCSHNGPGGFPSPMFNSGGWAPSCHDMGGGTVNWDTFGPVQSSYPFQSPPCAASNHYDFLGNAGFVANSPGINPIMNASAGYQEFPAPNSLPFNSLNAYNPHFGSTKSSELESELAKPIWTFLPPHIYLPQNFGRRKGRNVPSSAVPQSSSQRGLLTPPTEGFPSHAVQSIPSSLNVQSFGPIHSTLKLNPAQALRSRTPRKMGLQIANDHAVKPVPHVPLPGRVGGIQLGDGSAPQSDNDGILPRLEGLQVKNNMIQGQTHKPLENARDFVGPTSGSGPPEILRFPPSAQTSPSTGPGLSSVEVIKPARPSYATRESCLKRRAAEPLRVPSWGRRKKFVQVPLHSAKTMTQVAAATLPPPTTSAGPLIKWPGFVESPQLAGWKCLLCKKDLSFSPDNPAHQPTVPPAVAVLPCGHTFHDQCLQLITPADQAKDPPCIPCAIGEN